MLHMLAGAQAFLSLVSIVDTSSCIYKAAAAANSRCVLTNLEGITFYSVSSIWHQQIFQSEMSGVPQVLLDLLVHMYTNNIIVCGKTQSEHDKLC